jgi:hypothetical protein
LISSFTLDFELVRRLAVHHDARAGRAWHGTVRQWRGGAVGLVEKEGEKGSGSLG